MYCLDDSIRNRRIIAQPNKNIIIKKLIVTSATSFCFSVALTINFLYKDHYTLFERTYLSRKFPLLWVGCLLRKKNGCAYDSLRLQKGLRKILFSVVISYFSECQEEHIVRVVLDLWWTIILGQNICAG